MHFNYKVAEELKVISDKIVDLFYKYDEDQHRVELIDDHKWSLEYLKGWYKFVVVFFYFSLMMTTYAFLDGKAWWVNFIAVILIVVLAEVFVVSRILKNNAMSRLNSYQRDIDHLEKKFNEIADNFLLEEIYDLGLITIKNIIDKTSAKYVKQEIIQLYMEDQVKKGGFEEIKLKNGILYKCLLLDFQDNIERVVLEVN